MLHERASPTSMVHSLAAEMIATSTRHMATPRLRGAPSDPAASLPPTPRSCGACKRQPPGADARQPGARQPRTGARARLGRPGPRRRAEHSTARGPAPAGTAGPHSFFSAPAESLPNTDVRGRIDLRARVTRSFRQTKPTAKPSRRRARSPDRARMPGPHPCARAPSTPQPAPTP
jgi:hypothetical protein